MPPPLTIRRFHRALRRLWETGERRVDLALRAVLMRRLSEALSRTSAEAGPGWGILLVAYDLDRSRAAIRELQSVLDAKSTLVVVANAPTTFTALQDPPGIELLRGTNTAHEFSAYDQGLEHLRVHHPNLEVVVLANDRCLSYRDTFVPLLRSRLLQLCHEERLALGNLDDLGDVFRTPLGNVGRYLRGNMIVLPIKALPDDFHATTVDAATFDQVVPREFRAGLRLGDSLTVLVGDRAYATTLERWLTTGWYRGGEVSPESWSTLREKVRDILNEHLLSARLVEHGVNLVYAEQAAAVALMPRGGSSRADALRSVSERGRRVGVVARGDASARRTVDSLILALRAGAVSRRNSRT